MIIILRFILLSILVTRKMFSIVAGEDFTQRGCQSVKPIFHLLYLACF